LSISYNKKKQRDRRKSSEKVNDKYREERKPKVKPKKLKVHSVTETTQNGETLCVKESLKKLKFIEWRR
jgi:hypothetical protein